MRLEVNGATRRPWRPPITSGTNGARRGARSESLKAKVLIADDEEAVRLALAEYLRCCGYDVRTARGVAEAEPLPAEGGFAVVVTGLRFSGSDGKDGLEIARLAREHSPQSRVLLLTAYGSAETEAEARQIGVEALLHKPMPLWELARIVMGGAAA